MNQEFISGGLAGLLVGLFAGIMGTNLAWYSWMATEWEERYKRLENKE